MKNLGVVSEPDDIARLKDIGAGTGDVTGPASSVDSHVAIFNGTGGKTIMDGGALVEGVWLEEDVNGDLMPGTALLSGAGDSVIGPASATDGHLAVFDGTTGKLIKDGGAIVGGSGDVVGPASATDAHLAVYDGITGKLIKDGGTLPTTLPASDVSVWAKAATKPTYTASEISITDAGSLIAATEVETALQENRTAINLNTAKVTNATHTGDVTGSTVLTIGANKVTLEMMATLAANSIIGNSTASAATPVAKTCTAAGFALLDDADAATQIATLGITATAAELSYVHGVTSAIQTQLGGKLSLAGGTMTGVLVPKGHVTPAAAEVGAVCYGTGTPPSAATVPEGTVWIQYTA